MTVRTAPNNGKQADSRRSRQTPPRPITRPAWLARVFRPRAGIFTPLALALVGLALFASTLRNDTVGFWDDNRTVLSNPLIRDLGPSGVGRIFSQFYYTEYSPVLLLSYAIDHSIWGVVPAGYHLTSTLIHVLNGVLAFSLARRLLGGIESAGVAALLFVVHPLQVEAVAWVSGRNFLLATFFFLLSIIFHIHSLRGGASRLSMPLSWLCYILSTLSKPIAVGAPLVFAAYDGWWARLGWRQIVKRSLPMWAVASLGIGLLVVGQAQAGGLTPYRGDTWLETAQLMLLIFWDYFASLINPSNLSNLYIYDISIVRQDYHVWFGVGAVLASILMAWLQPVGKPHSRFSVLWIAALMLPFFNFLPLAIPRADRYVYLPLLGVGLLAGAGFSRLWNWPAARDARPLFSGGLAALAVPLIMLSWQRTQVWANASALWVNHLQHYPTSTTGYVNLAGYYFSNGNYALAEPLYKILLSLAPNEVRAPYNLGRIAEATGRYDDAIAYYLKAIKLKPEDTAVYDRLGSLLLAIGRYGDALTVSQAAAKIDANDLTAQLNAGEAALPLGQFEAAHTSYEAALRIDSRNSAAASGNCLALAALGDMTTAEKMCRHAVEVEPTNGLYLARLAYVLLLADDPSAAFTAARQAVSVSPDLALGWRALGDVYRALGSMGEAKKAYEAALKLDPNDQGAIIGLAKLTATAPLITPTEAPTVTPFSAGASIPVTGATTTPVALVSALKQVNMRTGPGISYEVVAVLDPTDKAVAVGRTSSGDWIKIESVKAPAGSAWVLAELVTLSAPADELPVVTP